MSRNSAPIQSSLEDVLTQLGAPDGYEDLSPRLDGRRVVATFDLSDYESKGGILVRSAQPITDVTPQPSFDNTRNNLNSIGPGQEKTAQIIGPQSYSEDQEVVVLGMSLEVKPTNVTSTTAEYVGNVKAMTKEDGIGLRTRYDAFNFKNDFNTDLKLYRNLIGPGSESFRIDQNGLFLRGQLESTSPDAVNVSAHTVFLVRG